MDQEILLTTDTYNYYDSDDEKSVTPSYIYQKYDSNMTLDEYDESIEAIAKFHSE